MKENMIRGTGKALRLMAPNGIRIPPGTPPEHAALADMAMSRMVDVMCEDVHPAMAPSVLKAACVVREEICGPIVKKIEVKASLEQLLTESMSVDREDDPPASQGLLP